MAEKQFVERIIEAGAYRFKFDMGYFLRKTPLVNVTIPNLLGRDHHDLMEVPDLEPEQMPQPLILTPEEIGELMAKKNRLDSIIRKEYQVISDYYDEKIIATPEKNNGNKQLANKKTYFLLGNDGRAEASELIINSKLNMKNNFFKRFSFTANIQGLLAGQGSPLAQTIVKYVKQYNLSLIDNRILPGDGETYFVEGSVKTRMIQQLKSDMQSEEFRKFFESTFPKFLKDRLSQAQREDIFYNGFDRIYRIKIIKE